MGRQGAMVLCPYVSLSLYETIVAPATRLLKKSKIKQIIEWK
jgi:hypothetical protein